MRRSASALRRASLVSTRQRQTSVAGFPASPKAWVGSLASAESTASFDRGDSFFEQDFMAAFLPCDDLASLSIRRRALLRSFFE